MGIDSTAERLWRDNLSKENSRDIFEHWSINFSSLSIISCFEWQFYEKVKTKIEFVFFLQTHELKTISNDLKPNKELKE